MKDPNRPGYVEDMPAALYNAECKSALTEIEELLAPLRKDYSAVAYCAALLAHLMKSVATWRNSSASAAMTRIARWAEDWKNHV